MEVKAQILKMIQKKESNLPTLSGVINRIISVASDEKMTTEDLAEIISYDKRISNQLLKLANAVYYAQETNIETVKRAVTVIGFDEIVGITLAMGILSSFSDESGLSLDMKALWIHGIGVATVSKELAKRTNPGIASKIFIPALLHDMGKVILSVYFKDEYRKVKQFAIEQNKPLYFAENAILKFDHAILSALLMKRWNFPQSIMIPCRFHHNPESAPIKFKHQSLIINLADYLTQKAQIGHSGNPVPVTVKIAAKKIGVNETVLKLMIDQVKRKESEIKEFFNITTWAA
ncbi:MAG: HDOD domain-containing protein [Deltaproteobacteria bacterium]|jgi:HD-like signal output (HDOD) protein|nr:HDOD domain-containing protein [Deltaproteobacteria bacterium]